MNSNLSPPEAMPYSRLRRWLREPLLHFILIGAMLFGGYAWINRNSLGPADARQIVLTEDDLTQLLVVWRAEGRPDPSPEQMQHLIETKVREEVLYREALNMGLDKDDTIVKRRMAQKLDFLAEDLSALREPSRPELQTWFKTNSQAFALSPRVSFRHLYFSFDEHGDKARDVAMAALNKIAGQPEDAPAASTLGDAFMFQNSYADRTPDQVGSVFGGKFAKELFELKPGAWSGPIESGFGWHLIFIESLTPGRVPEFEEIETDVKNEWVTEQRIEFKRQAYEVMRAKYEVVLPPSLQHGATNAPAAEKEQQ